MISGARPAHSDSRTYGGFETIRSYGPPTIRSAIMNSTSSPSRSAFARATSIASGELSIPVTRTPWRSWAIASAIAPLPVPTSSTRWPSSASSTSSSVSGRGTSTRWSTTSSSWRKWARAEDVGDRLAPDAAAHHLVERERRLHVEAPLGIGVQRGAVRAERGGEHQLRVEPRSVDAGRLERLGRRGERVADR